MSIWAHIILSMNKNSLFRHVFFFSYNKRPFSPLLWQLQRVFILGLTAV
jgi:hypothetical protein